MGLRMKRVALLLVSSVLVISLAAPVGAVFAIEGSVEEGDNITAEAVVETLEPEAESVAVPQTPLVSGKSVSVIEPKNYPAVSSSPAQTQEPRTAKAQVSAEKPRQAVDIAPPATDPVDDDMTPTGDVLVTAVHVKNGRVKDVELTNTTTKPVRVEGWQIVMMQFVDDGEECEIALSGYLLANRSVVFSDNTTEGAYTFESCGAEGVDGNNVRVVVEKSGVVFERVKLPGDGLYVRKGVTATYKKGSFDNDFGEKRTTHVFKTSTLYEPPLSTPLKIIELYPNPLPCTPSEGLPPTCADYVKLYNPTNEAIDLSQYKLRVGQLASSSTASNTYQLSGTIDRRSYMILQTKLDDSAITLSNDSGTAWLQDKHGLIDYPSEVPPYVGGDRVANKGRSWAYNSQKGEWQWANPAPWSLENDFTVQEYGKGGSTASQKTLKPCLPHQFRNPATNRCKNKEQANTLTPCKPGQYRNPETNRCRSVASTASTLKPCAPDQFRNPETNRCKKIASASEQKDCGPGRERNPLTNRCRNILASTPPAADFAVEPVAESASVFIGWWVLGGIALLAVGYAGWEWRAEIAQMARRIVATARPK